MSRVTSDEGGSQKVTNDDEGGSRYPPKLMTPLMNSPLSKEAKFVEVYLKDTFSIGGFTWH